MVWICRLCWELESDARKVSGDEMNAETDAVSDEKENRLAYGRMDRRLAVSREQVDWGAGWLAGWADGGADQQRGG